MTNLSILPRTNTANQKGIAWPVLLGMPNSGKGTNAKFIHEGFGETLYTIGTGDICRNEIKAGTLTGRIIQYDVENGFLIPDNTVYCMVEPLLNLENTLFDGFPRRKSQADMFMQYVSKTSRGYDIKITPMVFLLEVDEELAMERSFKRAEQAKAEGKPVRSDDTPEVMKNRLKIAKEQTMPLGEYFDKRNVPVLLVNANEDIFASKEIHAAREKLIGDFIRQNGFGKQGM